MGMFPTPDLVDPDADAGCRRWGYLCPGDQVDNASVDAALATADSVAAAMEGEADAREQLRLGLSALSARAGVGHVAVDLDHATLLSFTVDGLRVSVFTNAGLLQPGDAPVDVAEVFGPIPEPIDDETAQQPEGFRTRRSLPERYEPAGGPTNKRSALILDPFSFGSPAEIAGIFSQKSDEYTTIDLRVGAEVTPEVVAAARGYDAVHLLTHGGGSCPSWTNDRSECTSVFLGGPIESSQLSSGLNTGELCVAGNGAKHFCHDSGLFTANPNGIVFFGACGSDFGFNAVGAGASVGWTGTSQLDVVEGTAQAFWQTMVLDGVEFRLAEQLVKGSGLDSHTTSFWQNPGAVNTFTDSAFAGRNLRARDVIEVKVDGAEPRSQVLQVKGTPENGSPEKFPTKGQQVVFTLDGVKSGTEGGVQFEVYGNDQTWKADISLTEDGQIEESGDGFATWRVVLPPDSIEVPDIQFADLDPSAPPIDLEVRAFEQSSEYTAALGTVRLGTDIEFAGPIPIYEQLLDAFGEGEGNDLRVKLNSAGGPVTGSMRLIVAAGGVTSGEYTLDLSGEYDAAAGTLTGTATTTGFNAVNRPDMTSSDSDEGPFTGTVDLQTGTVRINFGNPPDQDYVGVIVDEG